MYKQIKGSMTNREYLITLLSDPDYVDDGGAEYESVLYYCLACPYTYIDEEAECYEVNGDYTREMCYRCKEKWLDSEVSL